MLRIKTQYSSELLIWFKEVRQSIHKHSYIKVACWYVQHIDLVLECVTHGPTAELHYCLLTYNLAMN